MSNFSVMGESWIKEKEEKRYPPLPKSINLDNSEATINGG